MSTDEQWEQWARTHPYYAVLADDKFRGTLSPETRAEFFSSGEAQVSHTLHVIRSQLAPGFTPRSALDFGCGTGRIVIPLARLCDTTGEDASPTMLAEAARNTAAAGVEAQFTRLADGKYDLITSFLVFQHIPTGRGIQIARRLIGQLNPGGVAVLHFVYRSRKTLAVKAVNWMRYRVPALQYALNYLRGRPVLDPVMQMNSYDLRDLLPLFEGNAVYLERADQERYLGFIFYVRKGAAQ
jgi:SAM-dependent methyltransferase